MQFLKRFSPLPRWAQDEDTAILVGRTGTTFMNLKRKRWYHVTDRPKDYKALTRPGESMVYEIGAREYLKLTKGRGLLAILENTIGLRPISKILDKLQPEDDFDLYDPPRITNATTEEA